MNPETPQDFRDRAAECERLASEAGNPRVRETLLYVAATWRRLAKEDEAALTPGKLMDDSPIPR
jgi:hypothetical protein